MVVIAMGGLSGGGARTLGPMVAERLGLDYVDRLILTDAARRVGATVEALHQREERPPTRGERLARFLQRVLERSAMTGMGGDYYFGPGAAAFLTQEYEDLPQPVATRGYELEDERYVEGIREVIRGLADRGNVVIIGRASYIILRDDPRVLRIGIEARLEDRIARIMERERLNYDQARKTVRDRDRARTYYFKRFFGIDNPDDPEYFHLMVNTSDVSADYAVRLIVESAKALEEGSLQRKPGSLL